MSPRLTQRLLVAVLFLAAVGPGRALAARQAPPRVQQSQRGAVYEVAGSFEVRASPQVAWSVVTDYASLGRFVKALEKNVVVNREPRHAVIEQEASAKALFFSKTFRLRLDVREAPLREVAFEDVSQHDFYLYQGSWSLEQGPGVTVVRYFLRADPKAAIPGAFLGSAFSGTAKELLGGVRAEIERRAGQSASR